jgi:hypothetical protein
VRISRISDSFLSRTWLTSSNYSYSTALLIGEKAAVLVAEDLGYSGSALDMKVPTYRAPGEFILTHRL